MSGMEKGDRRLRVACRHVANRPVAAARLHLNLVKIPLSNAPADNLATGRPRRKRALGQLFKHRTAARRRIDYPIRPRGSPPPACRWAWTSTRARDPIAGCPRSASHPAPPDFAKDPRVE